MKIFYTLALLCAVSFVSLYARNENIEKKVKYIIVTNEKTGKQTIYRQDILIIEGEEYCNNTKVSQIPKDYEKVYESNREMTERVIKKHKLGLMGLFIGVPIAQALHVYIEKKIDKNTQEAFTKMDETVFDGDKDAYEFLYVSERHNQPWYIAISKGVADKARIGFSLSGLMALWATVQDLKKGKQLKVIKKAENQNNQKK
jgi:hypothetical protein